MKTKIIFLFFMIPVFLTGQVPCPGLTGGTLTAVVEGNSVILKNDSAYRNCGSNYVMEISSIGNDTLVWKQRDIGGTTFCDCHFNYSVTLDSLKNGNYTAKVYYTVPGNYICYIGSVSFSILEPFPYFSLFLANSYQSTCLEMGIQSGYLNSINNLRVFPNPTETMLNINTHLRGPKVITISNLESKCLYEFRTENDEISYDITSLPKNMYFVTVINGEKSLHSKFIKN